MDCLSCGTANPDGNRFCGNCGEMLPQRCAACGIENTPGRRFCSACGGNLAEAARRLGAAPAAAPAAAELPEAERRQVSILFCDMVGSTALSTRFDPEELRELISEYHARVAVATERHGGFVARYLGDGVLAYFGWPTADESDAERAVRAGLAIIDAARTPLSGGELLEVRVGIATGLVVVGEVIGSGIAREHSVVGVTPNLAARLQTLAEPGSVLICRTTRDQIAGLFDCEDRGEVVIKGFGRPVPVWRVVEERPLASRFEARHATGLSPLFGRDEEVAMLLRRWQQIKSGEGCVVLLSGDAGIGKSRLVAELIEHLSDEDYLRARYFCSPHHRDSAFYPIIAYIGHQAGFARDDSGQRKAAKLAAALIPMQPSEEELALLHEMMSLPVPGAVPALGFSPQRKMDKTFAALCRWLECLAGARPVLVVLEDAHWADATTRALFDTVVERLRQLPIMLVVTFRPELAAPWVGQAGITLLALNRLGRREAAAIATHIDGAEDLRREQIDWIVAQSDGVPLFIEELTKSVVEGAIGAAPGGPAANVPRSLEGSLLARLDRLPGAKQVAQIGAVIGREFGYELIAAVTPMPESALIEGLDQLVAAGLLFARGPPPEAVYRFKHALLQDAAYESLLRSSRSAIHAKIVQALQRLASEVEASRPELLGHHCAQAGLTEQAADYYRRAGEQSLARSAVAEARTHLERGLALANSLPENPARHAQEAGLLLALGSVSFISEGYGAAGLASRMANAVALARRADRRPLLIRALRGEWDYKMHTGDLGGALGVAQEMMALAALEHDPIARVVAATSLGMNYAYAGRLGEARDLFETCLTEHAISAATGLGGPHPQDHEVLVRTYLARVLACLGETRQAAEEGRKAIERARTTQHRPSLAVALTLGCRQAWLLRDPALVQERAAELIKLSEGEGFPYWLARGRGYAGWVAVTEGRVEDGLALLTDALAHFDTTDVALGNIAGIIGDAYARAGHLATALRHLDNALRVSAKTGEAWMDAELHRLTGTVLGAGPAANAKSAEMHLLRALEIARSQGAKLWELRAAISLARLWARDRKFAEAIELLTPVRRWFAEDLGTPDLTDAEMLIGELCDAARRA